MAWFHFCTANHNKPGRSSLVDQADWFKAGLLDLGHKVTLSDNHLETSAINVFWEYFTPRLGKEIAKAGVVYGIVATEIPDGYAFNWRQEPSWKARFDSFHEVAKRASFIWAMGESTLPFYSRFCPSAYMELGFSKRLIPDYIDQTPEHDFCFFGQRTPYRDESIKKIRKYAEVEWPESFPSSAEVGKLIGRSKIGLCFKQSEQWPVPSQTRLGRLTMAKRGVAAEFVPVATRQGEIVRLCPQSSDFVDYAMDMLHSDWKHRAEVVFENYRSEMPMSEIMQCVLDQTLVGVGATVLRSKAPASAEIVVSLGRTSYRDGSGADTRIHIEPEDEAVLIGSIGRCNMVSYRNKFIGLPHSLGPIDITQHDLSAFHHVYESQEELERELTKIGKSFPEILVEKLIVTRQFIVALASKLERLLSDTR
jgi:hypothetical protein